MKSVVEKLNKVMKELGAIEKDGTNSFHKYDYVSHAGMMKKLNPLLVKHGVIISATDVVVVSCEPSGQSNRVVMSVKYEATDGETSLSACGVGEGVDKGDKASYKAQTGAHKYALKALFTIPDELDAEGDLTTDAEPEEIPRKYNMSKKDLIEAIGQYHTAGKIPKEIVDDWKRSYNLKTSADMEKLAKKDLDTMYNDVVSALEDQK